MSRARSRLAPKPDLTITLNRSDLNQVMMGASTFDDLIKAGFDLVWFGIFIVLLVEIAEVTPPVGFNLFVLQNMTGKDSNVIAKAALPFFACLIICIGLITVFPQTVTWLPDITMGKEK